MVTEHPFPFSEDNGLTEDWPLTYLHNTQASYSITSALLPTGLLSPETAHWGISTQVSFCVKWEFLLGGSRVPGISVP